MEVSVEEFVATSAADPNRKVYPKLWRVRVDKLHAGFIARLGDGIPPNAKLLLHLRFPDDERAEIEKQISEHFGRSVGSVQPSEMPEMEPEVDDVILDFEEEEDE